MTDMTSLTVSDVLQRIRFDPLTKKGSVYDVIQLVTGCAQSVVSRNLQSITSNFPDVQHKMINLKFPGRGQKPTPCAHVDTLVEIAWLCPGKRAKDFRRQGAVTLCRALGGDVSLIEEIKVRHAEIAGTDEQAVLLAGTGVSVAQASAEALQTSRRMELENDRYEALTAVVIKERVIALHLQLAGLGERAVEERDRLFYMDAARNLVASYFPSTITTGSAYDASPVTLSTMATEMGMRLPPGALAQAGRLASRLYYQRHGRAPPKHKQFVDGAVRLVNSYTEADCGLLQEALKQAVQAVRAVQTES